ncbi:MAG: DNA primase [Candidatus Saccharimonas sp.]
MQDAKEEIRSRLNIEDVVGEYVQLKRAGRNFKGLSPFSSEKTPSFIVSPDKNIWHDFSSNKGGDVFTFIMELEGMDFRQALEHLARKAGVDLSQFESRGAKQSSDLRKRLLEAHKLAVKYYQQSLLRNQHALEYVFGARKLSKQVVTDFLIGYAPDTGRALVGALTKRGYSKPELTKAGLANQYGSDMFRGRMMVPLMDATGQIIGFTGRIIGDVENAPKYLNTPETPLYNKGHHVFALSQAKEAIRTEGFVVIVEGNLDVVSSHQVGVCNVVATAGTAMTDHHLTTLKRLTTDVRLAYDGDKAGIAATERAIEIASRLDIELKVISLPDGFKDPDELIQSGVERWQTAITESRPAVEWVLDQYAVRLDLDSANGKQQFIDIARSLLEKLEGRAEVRHYMEKIAKLIGFSYEDVMKMVKREDVDQQIIVDDNQIRNPRAAFEEMKFRYEDDVLALGSLDIANRELFEHADSDMFHGDERQALVKFFVKNTNESLEKTPKELQNYDTYVKIVLLRADTRYASWDSNDRYYETARLLRQILNEHRKQKQAELTNQLRNAERLGDDMKATALRVELNGLIKEIARGKR